MRLLAPAVTLLCSAALLVAAAPASAAVYTPKSAAGFRDSVGVQTHASYYDTAYGNWPLIVQRLDELGIDHLRDGAFASPDPHWHDWMERYDSAIALAAAHGHRFLLGMGFPGFTFGSINDLAMAVAGRLRPAVEALEAPNEYDTSGGTADWPTLLRSYLQGLHARVKGDPALRDLPLVGPSFGSDAGPGRMGRADDLFDVGNTHSYTGGLSPSPDLLGGRLAQAALVSGSEPVWATEEGFQNAMNATVGQPPVPEDVAAVYTLRTLLENYGDGIARTYLYELIDEKPDPAGVDPEQHFGLLRNDFSLKPAAVALENLLRVVGRPRPPAALTPVSLSASGDTTGVRGLLLEGDGGSYQLVLWQTASLWDVNRRVRLDVPSRHVDVTVPASAVTEYRPVLSASGTPVGAPGGHVALDLGADPVVLAFSVPSAAGPAAPTPSAPGSVRPLPARPALHAPAREPHVTKVPAPRPRSAPRPRTASPSGRAPRTPVRRPSARAASIRPRARASARNRTCSARVVRRRAGRRIVVTVRRPGCGVVRGHARTRPRRAHRARRPVRARARRVRRHARQR